MWPSKLIVEWYFRCVLAATNNELQCNCGHGVDCFGRRFHPASLAF